jgi:hypothetical protein
MLPEQQDARKGPGHDVAIVVNEHPVTVEGPRTTGLAIKEAAIAQGAEIELDFVLSQELGGGRTKIIADHEDVTVHPGSRFVAIPNDDNS